MEPKPLSDEWLFWNPETIHAYPDSPESEEPTTACLDGVVPEPASAPRRRRPRKPPIAGELVRYLVAGLAAGLASATLLALLVLALPG